MFSQETLTLQVNKGLHTGYISVSSEQARDLLFKLCVQFLGPDIWKPVVLEGFGGQV